MSMTQKENKNGVATSNLLVPLKEIIFYLLSKQFSGIESIQRIQNKAFYLVVVNKIMNSVALLFI